MQARISQHQGNEVGRSKNENERPQSKGVQKRQLGQTALNRGHNVFLFSSNPASGWRIQAVMHAGKQAEMRTQENGNGSENQNGDENHNNNGL